MTFAEIKKRYSYLTSAELEKELKLRSTSRTGSWMVGAENCMLNTYVIRACREILSERKI